MTCNEFRARYTDFRDGLIGAAREVRRFERHLATCAQCRRYDAALREGIGALRDATRTMHPRADFRSRLDARLEQERASAARPPSPRQAAFAAGLLVAVALGLLALAGIRHPQVAETPALPAVPFPKPVVRAGLPFVSFQDPRSSVVTGNPYPYGTAFVEPASARPASATR
jgi:anti-sigma factor RsiW